MRMVGSSGLEGGASERIDYGLDPMVRKIRGVEVYPNSSSRADGS